MTIGLPEHTRQAATDYIEYGKPPVGFLRAALENDFRTAVLEADPINREWIFHWAQWLHWDVPSIAWGNREKVDQWIRDGGLQGRAQLRAVAS